MIGKFFRALGVETKPASLKLLEQAIAGINDNLLQWIQDAAEEDPSVIELSVPLTLKISKADWDSLETKYTGQIKEPKEGKVVLEHYPFLAREILEWGRVQTLYGSENIGFRLEFANPPETETNLEIVVFTKNNFNLRQLLSRILADSEVYRRERNL